MGIMKDQDIIAWRDGDKIICAECGDPGEAIPLSENDFANDENVTCDECPKRIL